MAAKEYRKHYLPLESNPEVFTSLIHKLGISEKLAFHDVYSLDPELLAFTPRPVLALMLVFPASQEYEKDRAQYASTREEYTGKGQDEPVIWYKQTIHNACGLYGILHAVSNGLSKDSIEPDSILAHLLDKVVSLEPTERALALEDDLDLEAAHKEAALQGDTSAPASPEDEVQHHYVCFVKSQTNNHLYILDGDYKGPEKDILMQPEDDLLSGAGVGAVQKFMDRAKGQDLGFSLLALAPA